LPALPTLTTLVGAVPANAYVTPPITALVVGLAAAVTEPFPSATLSAFAAVAALPNAIEFAADATALVPIATEFPPTAEA